MLGISRCILTNRMANAAVPFRVEIGAHSLPSCLTCLSSPGRASNIQSSPRAGGAGRAKSARFDGVKLVRLARNKQANKSLSAWCATIMGIDCHSGNRALA